MDPELIQPTVVRTRATYVGPRVRLRRRHFRGWRLVDTAAKRVREGVMGVERT